MATALTMASAGTSATGSGSAVQGNYIGAPAATSSVSDAGATASSAVNTPLTLTAEALKQPTSINVDDMVGDSPHASNVKGHISQQRRRLTVISDSRYADGDADRATKVGKVSILADDKDEGPLNKGNVVKTYYGVSKKGYAPYNPRKQNQDSIIMETDPKTGCILYAALDGHGEVGDFVSQYFRDRLPRALFGHPCFPKDIKTAFCDCIAKIEQAVLAEPRIDTKFSGTTAVMCTIYGDELTCANVGDSRIILGAVQNGQLVVEEVSHDHKPDLKEEQARIEAAGGRVFAVQYEDGIDGPARVWLAKVDIPGLAMSRSLGDTVAHSVGVSSVPEITFKKLGPQHKLLIMGSDGLWEFISNTEALKSAFNLGDPAVACEALCKEAYKRWMDEEQVVDDTTVIIAHF